MTGGFITQKVNKKIGILATSIASAAIGLMFLLDFVKEQELLQTVLIVAARFISTYLLCFFALLECSLMPIEIRNTSFALIDGIS